MRLVVVLPLLAGCHACDPDHAIPAPQVVAPASPTGAATGPSQAPKAPCELLPREDVYVLLGAEVTLTESESPGSGTCLYTVPPDGQTITMIYSPFGASEMRQQADQIPDLKMIALSDSAVGMHLDPTAFLVQHGSRFVMISSSTPFDAQRVETVMKNVASRLPR